MTRFNKNNKMDLKKLPNRSRCSLGKIIMTKKNCLLILFLFFSIQVNALQYWKTLPATPTLPATKNSGYLSVNNVRLWYGAYGEGRPVILLHGGLGNSNYFAKQVTFLTQNHYQAIVMDSRGHGRSFHNEQAYDYHLMATDVLKIMDLLKIKRAALIGWSDGAIIGLDIAIYSPDRLAGLFAFGPNSTPEGVREDVMEKPVMQQYLQRTKQEYKMLSPTPNDYDATLEKLSYMMKTQPNFTAKQLQSISVPVWVVDGDHDEGIKISDIKFIAKQIPQSKLLIQKNVSHFSFLQNSKKFNEDVLMFLKNINW